MNKATEQAREEKEAARKAAATSAKAEADASAHLVANAGALRATQFVAKLTLDEVPEEERLGILKKRAAAQFKAGELQEAEELYGAALCMGPPNHQLYSNRSACRSAQRLYEDALADAQQCVKLAPSWGKGYARAGAALHGLCRWSDAVVAYERGMKADASEASHAALVAGVASALRRKARAGGQWRMVVGSAQTTEIGTKEGPKTLPVLGCRAELCEKEIDFRGLRRCAFDQPALRQLVSTAAYCCYGRYTPPRRPGGAMCACPGACVSLIDGDQVPECRSMALAR